MAVRDLKVALCHPEREHYAKGMCSICYGRLDYAKHRDARRVKCKAYREKNRTAVKATIRAWRARNKERIRDKRLMAAYRLTADEWRAMRDSQGGRCAICRVTFSSTRSVHVDHDHVTGAVRGLLCVRCNVMIAQAQDDAHTLFSAVLYLRRHKRAAS